MNPEATQPTEAKAAPRRRAVLGVAAAALLSLVALALQGGGCNGHLRPHGEVLAL